LRPARDRCDRPHTTGPLTTVRDPRRAHRSAEIADAALTLFTASTGRREPPETAVRPHWAYRPYQPKSGSIDFVEEEFRRDHDRAGQLRASRVNRRSSY
jgi:hypothetical protein